MRLKQFLFLSICLLFSIVAKGQSIQLVSKFDSRLIKYYKVDTCRVYENVNNGQQTLQFLRKLYIFDQNGNISQEVEFGQNEYDGHTITKYEYNSYNLITSKLVLRPQSDPLEYYYSNSGNKWLKLVTT